MLSIYSGLNYHCIKRTFQRLDICMGDVLPFYTTIKILTLRGGSKLCKYRGGDCFPETGLFTHFLGGVFLGASKILLS